MPAGGPPRRRVPRRFCVTRAVECSSSTTAPRRRSRGRWGRQPRAALREHALELVDTEGTPLVLDAADELLFACAMGARTVPVQTCQWLVDVYRLLHSPEAPTADALLERARRVRLVAHVRATVRYLAEIADDEVLHDYAVGVRRRTDRAEGSDCVRSGRSGREPGRRDGTGSGPLPADHGRRSAPSRGGPSAPASAGTLGSREPRRRAAASRCGRRSASEPSGSGVGAGPEPLRVVLRLVSQLLRRVRDVPEPPGVGRDAVVDAVAELERRPRARSRRAGRGRRASGASRSGAALSADLPRTHGADP